MLIWGLGFRMPFLSTRNVDGDCILHLAARLGDVSACEKLVEAGALLKAKNKPGETAPDVAWLVMAEHFNRAIKGL